MDNNKSKNTPGYPPTPIYTFRPHRARLSFIHQLHGLYIIPGCKHHFSLHQKAIEITNNWGIPMLLSTTLHRVHKNGIYSRMTQTIAYGIEPLSTLDIRQATGTIDEISYPVSWYAVLLKGIPEAQMNPPLGPHLQAFSIDDALGYDVLRRPTMEASHEGEMGLRVHVRSFRGHE
jgi:hypothetical protein